MVKASIRDKWDISNAFTLIGSGLKTYNKEYNTYDLLEFGHKSDIKVKTRLYYDCDKEALRSKDEIYDMLKTEKSKSGNRLYKE